MRIQQCTPLGVALDSHWLSSMNFHTYCRFCYCQHFAVTSDRPAGHAKFQL